MDVKDFLLQCVLISNPHLLCIIGCCFLFPALQPANIMEFFEPVFQQAQELQKAYSGYSGKTKIPFVMVHTYSCIDYGYNIKEKHAMYVPTLHV